MGYVYANNQIMASFIFTPVETIVLIQVIHAQVYNPYQLYLGYNYSKFFRKQNPRILNHRKWHEIEKNAKF